MGIIKRTEIFGEFIEQILMDYECLIKAPKLGFIITIELSSLNIASLFFKMHFIHDLLRSITNTTLTLNAAIATKVVCFSRLLKCVRSLYGKQCRPRSVCSGSTLFASILNSSVMLGNILQQTTFSDAFFSWPFKG